jgi:hypothetical protein
MKSITSITSIDRSRGEEEEEEFITSGNWRGKHGNVNFSESIKMIKLTYQHVHTFIVKGTLLT